MSVRKGLVAAALCLSLVPTNARGDVTSTEALRKSVAGLDKRVKAMEEMRAKGTVQDPSVCKKLLAELARIKKGLDAEDTSITQDTQNATSEQKQDINWVIKMKARREALEKAQKAFDDAGLEKRIPHLCEPDAPKKGSTTIAPTSPKR